MRIYVHVLTVKGNTKVTNFHSKAFRNSRMFPDLKQARKKPVPNAGLSRDREEDAHECSGLEISQNFLGKKIKVK